MYYLYSKVYRKCHYFFTLENIFLINCNGIRNSKPINDIMRDEIEIIVGVSPTANLLYINKYSYHEFKSCI